MIWKNAMGTLSRAMSVGVAALFLYSASLQSGIGQVTSNTDKGLSLLFALAALVLFVAAFIDRAANWVADNGAPMLEVLLLPGLAGLVNAVGKSGNSVVTLAGFALYLLVAVAYVGLSLRRLWPELRTIPRMMVRRSALAFSWFAVIMVIMGINLVGGPMLYAVVAVALINMAPIAL